MSYEIDWWVSRMPSRGELDQLLRAVCAECGLAADAARAEWDDVGLYEIIVTVPADRLHGVQQALGDNHGWTLESFLEHIDLPERRHLHPEDGVYELDCQLVAEEPGEDPPLPPRVQAGEGTSDNNAVWPVIELFAAALAERIGIHEDDEDRGDEIVTWSPPPKIV
jgi:hypothetical protein